MRKVSKAQEVFTKLTPANLSKLLNNRFEALTGTQEGGDEGEEGVNESSISLRTGRVEYVSNFRAEMGKKVAIPVRVEPKVFFANERTCERF